MTRTFRRIKHRLWWLLAPPVVSSILTSWLAVQMVSLGDRADAIESTRSSLGSLLSYLKDAETGQRGFLLTGDTRYLEPYNAALQSLPAGWTKLENAVAKGYVDQRALETLHRNADAKLHELAQTIDVYRAGDVKSAMALVASGDGRSMMDGIRSSVGSLFRGLDAATRQSRTREMRYRDVFFVLGIASVVLTIVGLSLFMALVRRYGAIRDWQEEELRQMNLTLEGKVSERTAELADVNRDLADFVSIAAHDLNAPLRTSGSLLELFLMRYSSGIGGDGLALLDRVQRSMKSLQSLLSSLLQYYKVNAEIGAPMEGVPLGKAVHAAVANLQPSLDGSDGQISVADLPEVEGNAPLLTLVFQNLIENSMKYRRTDVPLKVQVDSSSEPEQTVITVQDNGIGFDPKYKEKIFQPFTRLHDRGEYQGSGIGLATCARIVERHGGSIWAESAMGSGSTFFVRLPLKKTTGLPEIPAVAN